MTKKLIFCSVEDSLKSALDWLLEMYFNLCYACGKHLIFFQQKCVACKVT